MTSPRYNAIVLAAGRGPDDPMARAFGVSNKSLLPVAGTPMLMRVLAALAEASTIASITISIEDPALLESVDGFADLDRRLPVRAVTSADSASASVASALGDGGPDFPVLVTTADHALLSAALVDEFCRRSLASGADLTVGLARDATILAAYPGAVRTFLQFSDGRYSGCNLFTFNSARAHAAINFWRRVESNRKSPWKLVGAFGLGALVSYVTGTLSLSRAFSGGSKRLGVAMQPVELMQAEAAIDVDKPSDLELVEEILAGR